MGGRDQEAVPARGGEGPTPRSWVDALPPDIVDGFGRYDTCELSTVAKDGTPITWPTTPLFQPDEGRFVVGTAIGLNRKALHVRREPRVAMLFSDPTGTDRTDLPTILVQGMARCPEDLNVSGPLVRDLTRWLASFDSAVLVWRDADLYPSSTRCHPVPDHAKQMLAIEPGPGDRLRAGPAGLLCHSHDRDTWNLRSFHVNGELRQDDAGWWFVPARLIPGTGLTGFRGNIAWLRGSSREARDYLRTRGLAKPRIDWAEIDSAKKEGAALFEQARRVSE